MDQPTIVRCGKCQTEFRPKIYPSRNEDVGLEINCPVCQRGYFYDEELGVFSSDRFLEIVEVERGRLLEANTPSDVPALERLMGVGQKIVRRSCRFPPAQR
jgi:uncharacterized protein (DUF983 family)